MNSIRRARRQKQRPPSIVASVKEFLAERDNPTDPEERTLIDKLYEHREKWER